MDYIREHGNIYLLGWIIGGMFKAGNFHGVEIGFIRALSQALLQGGEP